MTIPAETASPPRSHRQPGSSFVRRLGKYPAASRRFPAWCRP